MEEETPRNCFLDATRTCGADCRAFQPSKPKKCELLQHACAISQALQQLVKLAGVREPPRV